MRKLSMDELGRLSVEEFKRAAKKPVIAVLDNIRSMHNVGSVFRTADAFLIEAIFLCGYTPQPPHRGNNKLLLTLQRRWIKGFFNYGRSSAGVENEKASDIFANACSNPTLGKCPGSCFTIVIFLSE